ncbi:MAG: ATP-binding protein [Casimicrobium sp.]
MIHNFPTEDEFGSALAEQVSPSRPIQSPEFLFGRGAELDRIRKALYAPGRHIFVFGDRGVGKSSLGATAATLAQSADKPHLSVAGAPGETFQTIVASIASQAVGQNRLHRIKSTIALKGKTFFAEGEAKEERDAIDFRNSIVTMGDALEVLRQVANAHSERPIVLVDEFDRIDNASERAKFADLLKHLGDKGVPMRFIFTGIALSLDELLGAHPSAHRQLETIELPKLSWNSRWEILIQVCKHFGVKVPREIYIRIAAMSDGYPYYVHLLAEKLLWAAFEDPSIVVEVEWSHYQIALREAIQSINAELKRPYERAVLRRGAEYEAVLWSTADTDFLQRTASSMYLSYLHIAHQRDTSSSGQSSDVSIDQKAFASRVRSLMQDTYGAILRKDTSRGYYVYRENMLRGYVRMQAEANGIDLIGDREAPGEASARQKLHVPSSANRGYHTSSIPRGVKTGHR